MSIELTLSMLAFLMAFASLVWTVVSHRQQSHDASISAAFPLMAQAESMLKEIPTALRFHNVTEDELQSFGLTHEEFAYLLMNFTAAGIYYRMHDPSDESPFPKDSYRYQMLASPSTRRAWPILKRFINTDIGNYANKIEKTILIIETTGKDAT
ncbi:MAG: hypothetical protein AAFY08_04260 [Planctomycetota bacterium]